MNRPTTFICILGPGDTPEQYSLTWMCASYESVSIRLETRTRPSAVRDAFVDDIAGFLHEVNESPWMCNDANECVGVATATGSAWDVNMEVAPPRTRVIGKPQEMQIPMTFGVFHPVCDTPHIESQHCFLLHLFLRFPRGRYVDAYSKHTSSGMIAYRSVFTHSVAPSFCAIARTPTFRFETHCWALGRYLVIDSTHHALVSVRPHYLLASRIAVLIGGSVCVDMGHASTEPLVPWQPPPAPNPFDVVQIEVTDADHGFSLRCTSPRQVMTFYTCLRQGYMHRETCTLCIPVTPTGVRDREPGERVRNSEVYDEYLAQRE